MYSLQKRDRIPFFFGYIFSHSYNGALSLPSWSLIFLPAKINDREFSCAINGSENVWQVEENVDSFSPHTDSYWDGLMKGTCTEITELLTGVVSCLFIVIAVIVEVPFKDNVVPQIRLELPLKMLSVCSFKRNISKIVSKENERKMFTGITSSKVFEGHDFKNTASWLKTKNKCSIFLQQGNDIISATEPKTVRANI